MLTWWKFLSLNSNISLRPYLLSSCFGGGKKNENKTNLQHLELSSVVFAPWARFPLSRFGGL